MMQQKKNPDKVPFVEAVAEYGPGIVCLTGGGGKTTLMYSLARQLAHRGARVLVTTSTRIMRPKAGQTDFFKECENADEICLPREACVYTAARSNADGDKPEYLRSFLPEEINALWNGNAADWIIVEADGAAGRPLKAPSQKEPVIPGQCRIVIAVVGLSGLGKHFTDSWVFRPANFAELSGLKPGQIVSPEAVARVIRHERGLFKNTPSGAARLVFFNQTDLPGAKDSAEATAKALQGTSGVPLSGVFAGAAKHGDLLCFRLAGADPAS